MNKAGKIRVLVVDDSVVMRRLLSEAIASDAALEVAGYAANGQIALNLLDTVSPDLITLDIEMPVLDGLATLKALRAQRRTLPVIMFSTMTERGAEATIDSLALGASDYVAKPAGLGSYQAARDRIREALLPKIKAVCARHTGVGVASAAPVALPRLHHPCAARVDIVAIGCSTGGPNALAQVLPGLPADLTVPVLIVQHMPPTFTRFLAQRLNSLCPLPVVEAAGGEALRPGGIWVAPGGFHLTVLREGAAAKLQLSQAPPENSCRPSVDVLFRSLAPVFADRVLAVVLTGMGQDGLRGCELLASSGAQIIAQDEATSVVWGMPGFVAKAGLADAVLPLEEIAGRIVERVRFQPAAPAGRFGMQQLQDARAAR
jgi:two-component system, chemotaxis family, protein-glutamate methylesterase/glutaminase